MNKSRRGKPKRWSGDIVETTGSLWSRVANNRDDWNSLKEAYTTKGSPYAQ